MICWNVEALANSCHLPWDTFRSHGQSIHWWLSSAAIPSFRAFSQIIFICFDIHICMTWHFHNHTYRNVFIFQYFHIIYYVYVQLHIHIDSQIHRHSYSVIFTHISLIHIFTHWYMFIIICLDIHIFIHSFTHISTLPRFKRIITRGSKSLWGSSL